MIRQIPLATMASMALLAVCAPQPVQAQSAPKTVVCNFVWCPIQVQVVKSPAGAEVVDVDFNQIKMASKLPGTSVNWKLLGSPDYEFRIDSVTSKGANAASAPAQFPVRLISANEFAVDDLNTNSLTYEYDVRVYKKGSPPGSTPLVSSGTVVNAAN